MFKLIVCFLLAPILFYVTPLYAQSTENAVTSKDRMNYEKTVNEVKKRFGEKGQIKFYYNVDSLLAYEQLLRKEQNKIKFKKEEFVQLTYNYDEINSILLNFVPKPETFARVDSLMQQNYQLVYAGIFENNVSTNPEILLPVPVTMRFLNSADEPVTNVRCYFISRRVCRDIICTTCIIDFITNGCTGEFMMKVKENPFFDALNPQPV